jgi:hypothetical protein
VLAGVVAPEGGQGERRHRDADDAQDAAGDDRGPDPRE